jgi:hypothetical protein
MRLSLLTSQNVSFPSSKALQKPADRDMAVRSVSMLVRVPRQSQAISSAWMSCLAVPQQWAQRQRQGQRNRDMLWLAGLRNRCKREGERRRVKGEGEGGVDKPLTLDRAASLVGGWGG